MRTPLVVIIASMSLLTACSDTHRAEPSTQNTASIRDASVHRRAIEAVIWGMPAVNYERMLAAAAANGARPNQVVYWSRPLNWKTQNLTPNPDTIYFQPFYDTTAGPVVLEVPASDGGCVIVGSVDNGWQVALEDAGVAGMDKGKGGKYLITPPGYTGATPDGYFVLRSDTYRGFAILRSNFKSRSDADIAAAVAHGKKMRLYPLGGDAGSTVFVDVFDKPYDATIPYDASFFDSLNRFVQAEPWITRDKAVIDSLRTVGIEKGKPFAPDADRRAALGAAAVEARAYLNMKYEAGYAEPFFAGTHWAMPFSKEALEGVPSNFADPSSYVLDERAVMYSIAYFSAKHLGAGQFYLLNTCDRSGAALDGGKTYRLRVPADAPVEQYWSVTAYDRETHALIVGVPRPSLASNDASVQKNADGSTDVYFGPRAPAGKESNWVPTDAGRGFELLFRLYGPKKALFEKSWKLPDVEEVK
ncbi:MAG: DUF1254 domain-containing protein [Phycisphaerales bacterium]